ncbi:fimbrial protein [Salmonella enterica]|uniref:Type 1 fimbrial protein n=1 Tax=Salmonella enterica TaxID=28901 RepID=A0A634F917_SALER|nr:type 1 fimbrial protein [Salmonella enterica subsp. arizonae serovar 63:z4,z23:-]EAY4650536.1 type 1 fimbrial protein [Salmonella enterica]VEA46387.1 Fimbrial adhesin [Salmonella enterica subsp. arizonae]EDH4585918.1 type 1 fimbrial protein [Salmonella enterica]EFT8082495.1 fimbrial protein [Salmonella enterica]
MRGLLKSGCVLVLWLVSFGVQASCNYASGVTGEVPGYISFGNVEVPRDAPVGSVIATATTGAYNGGHSMAGCTTAWTYRWELGKWGSLSTLGGNIYNTNLPGIGIRLSNVNTRKMLPYDQAVGGNAYIVISGDGIKAELIKTGDITGGTLNTGVLARASVANQFYFANVTLNGSNTVSSVACSVNTPNVDVPLGQHEKSEFSGVGSTTEWKQFNIGLDCDKGANIMIQIDATQDPSSVPGVIKLDSATGDMAATGAGVQLYFASADNAVKFGKSLYYDTSLNGGSETVQLKARYYQTSQAITAGTANATATFTLSYR